MMVEILLNVLFIIGCWFLGMLIAYIEDVIRNEF